MIYDTAAFYSNENCSYKLSLNFKDNFVMKNVL